MFPFLFLTYRFDPMTLLICLAFVRHRLWFVPCLLASYDCVVSQAGPSNRISCVGRTLREQLGLVGSVVLNNLLSQRDMRDVTVWRQVWTKTVLDNIQSVIYLGENKLEYNFGWCLRVSSKTQYYGCFSGKKLRMFTLISKTHIMSHR